ncbi:LLM class oxidoreductase [Rhodopirellula sallentina]|uniref:Luciferase family protein n=1 Tax=Rhodopirellula sallentina SM41 TaxID=1263870 RepID=M5UBF2_9BACT|nr:LLM class oxidoreductase [Rhodopirellula sallentina]EMI53328.1 luciferase family protein [Rhodopirellula sallentina SM41]
MISTTSRFQDSEFRPINRGYNSALRVNRLSVGLVVPIENYDLRPVPTMQRHIERVQLAEKLGFSAVWLRDVPFNVPSFGDAGQTYDPFVYLGMLAGLTQQIALGVASIVLPLRHPAHVAKAAATADVLSGGRLILGVASGDRPEEYPALKIPFADRGAAFRESFQYIREMSQHSPSLDNRFGKLRGDLDMLPKPSSGSFPMLITGGSQQTPQWIAENGDGWMTYPRSTMAQTEAINAWRESLQRLGRPNQPVMQPLYVDLTTTPDTPPQPIHLGFRMGSKYLRDYLSERQEIGVNHIALNLRFNREDVEATMVRIAEDILPHFHQ